MSGRPSTDVLVPSSGTVLTVSPKTKANVTHASKNSISPSLTLTLTQKSLLIFVLAIQIALYIIVRKVSQTIRKETYSYTSVLCMVEVVKFIVSIGMIGIREIKEIQQDRAMKAFGLIEDGKELGQCPESDLESKSQYQQSQIIQTKTNFKKFNFSCDSISKHMRRYFWSLMLTSHVLAGVATVYLVMNLLTFYALQTVDAVVVVLMFQIKLLTTAFFARILLNRVLSWHRLAAIVVLILGVLLVTLETTPDAIKLRNQIETCQNIGNFKGSDGNTNKSGSASDSLKTNSNSRNLLESDITPTVGLIQHSTNNKQAQSFKLASENSLPNSRSDSDSHGISIYSDHGPGSNDMLYPSLQYQQPQSQILPSDWSDTTITSFVQTGQKADSESDISGSHIKNPIDDDIINQSLLGISYMNGIISDSDNDLSPQTLPSQFQSQSESYLHHHLRRHYDNSNLLTAPFFSTALAFQTAMEFLQRSIMTPITEPSPILNLFQTLSFMEKNNESKLTKLDSESDHQHNVTVNSQSESATDKPQSLIEMNSNSNVTRAGTSSTRNGIETLLTGATASIDRIVGLNNSNPKSVSESQNKLKNLSLIQQHKIEDYSNTDTVTHRHSSLNSLSNQNYNNRFSDQHQYQQQLQIHFETPQKSTHSYTETADQQKTDVYHNHNANHKSKQTKPLYSQSRHRRDTSSWRYKMNKRANKRQQESDYESEQFYQNLHGITDITNPAHYDQYFDMESDTQIHHHEININDLLKSILNQTNSGPQLDTGLDKTVIVPKPANDLPHKIYATDDKFYSHSLANNNDIQNSSNINLSDTFKVKRLLQSQQYSQSEPQQSSPQQQRPDSEQESVSDHDIVNHVRPINQAALSFALDDASMMLDQDINQNSHSNTLTQTVTGNSIRLNSLRRNLSEQKNIINDQYTYLWFLGFLAMCLEVTLSGFIGVYMEIQFKGLEKIKKELQSSNSNKSSSTTTSTKIKSNLTYETVSLTVRNEGDSESDHDVTDRTKVDNNNSPQKDVIGAKLDSYLGDESNFRSESNTNIIDSNKDSTVVQQVGKLNRLLSTLKNLTLASADQRPSDDQNGTSGPVNHNKIELKSDIWDKNFQLSFFSIFTYLLLEVFSATSLYKESIGLTSVSPAIQTNSIQIDNDNDNVRNNNYYSPLDSHININKFDSIFSVFFRGWSILSVFLVLLGALGGLIVAFTLKYTDAVTKAFGVSSAIVMVSFMNAMFLNGPTNHEIWIGSVMVILGTGMWQMNAE